MSYGKAPHHRGTYHVASRTLVAHAYADTATRCRRCHLTYVEGLAKYGESGARWTAGHVNDGEVDGELRPEHHHCNSSAGATAGNRRRNRNKTSRQW